MATGNKSNSSNLFAKKLLSAGSKALSSNSVSVLVVLATILPFNESTCRKKDVFKYKQQLLNPPDLLGAPLLPTSKLEVEAPTIDCQVLSVSERNM